MVIYLHCYDPSPIIITDMLIYKLFYKLSIIFIILYIRNNFRCRISKMSDDNKITSIRSQYLLILWFYFTSCFNCKSGGNGKILCRSTWKWKNMEKFNVMKPSIHPFIFNLYFNLEYVCSINCF